MNNSWILFFRPRSGIQETLPRLTAMIRGIGDPLVAAYTRAYLCRVRNTSSVESGQKSFLLLIFSFVGKCPVVIEV